MSEQEAPLAEPPAPPARPLDPEIAPLLEALRQVGGADDTRPEAEVLDDLEARAAAISDLLASRARAERLEGLRLEIPRLQESAVAGPQALGALQLRIGEARAAIGIKPKRARFGLGDALVDRPPPKSVCRKLEWEIGRPPMLIGPPGAGKTFIVQAASLDLVAGRPLWGCPDFRPPGPCRVLHVDLDQGKDKTLRRQKRLMRGRGVMAADETGARAELAAAYDREAWELGVWDLDEGAGLRLGSTEPTELARWTEAWIDAASGYDVCFVDSLRRLAPSLEENDSRISILPDTMRVVSERAQCVIVLLHHASNKGGGFKGAPKASSASRGSSAIDGAAGTQLAIDPDGDTIKVTQQRAGESARLEPFAFAFEDDPADKDGIRGIRVVYQTAEQAKAPATEAKTARLRALAERIWHHVAKSVLKTGHGVAGRKAIVTAVEGRDRDLYAAIDLLIDEKRLREGTETRDGKKIPRIWALQAQEEA